MLACGRLYSTYGWSPHGLTRTRVRWQLPLPVQQLRFQNRHCPITTKSRPSLANRAFSKPDHAIWQAPVLKSDEIGVAERSRRQHRLAQATSSQSTTRHVSKWINKENTLKFGTSRGQVIVQVSAVFTGVSVFWFVLVCFPLHP